MEKVIGIDLGTTYSAVSVIDQFGKATIVKNSDDENLTPSVIYFDPSGDIIVGTEAKEKLLSGDMDIAMFFKRHMGVPNFFLTFHEQAYTPTDLSAILLKKLKADAELNLSCPINKAVITVPAYFNDLQRTETIKAAEQAGLEVLRIINEPTAASIVYGMNHSTPHILVYDLGGGTFDVTVLSIADNSIQVLATGGDHELGGKDWDDMILVYVAGLFESEFGDDPLNDLETYNDLAFKVEVAKKQLSSTMSTKIVVSYKGNQGRYDLTRDKFEELTMSLLHNTTFKSQEVLNESHLTWDDLNGVLLVGGSTKMPMVSKWVKEMSKKDPLTGINVDEAVAFGAAIQAQIEIEKQNKYSLVGNTAKQSGYLLVSKFKKEINDVMSHSLGLIAINADQSKYINSIIIPKNLTIPSSNKRPYKYKTKAGDANELDVYLTQGETDDVAKSLIVAKYVFSGMQHLPQDQTTIDIEYQYDSNGVINVLGVQRETGIRLTANKHPLSDDLSWLYKTPRSNIPHMSIAIGIDLSGSMSGAPIKAAMAAANNFVNNIDLTNSSISIVAFASKTKTLVRLSQNGKDLTNNIEKLGAMVCKGDLGYGTSSHPFDEAYKELKNVNDPRFILVLTDGAWESPDRAIESAKRCIDDGIEIIAIGFGSANHEFLKKIATSDENAMLTSQSNLSQSFGNIAQELTEQGGLLKKR